MATGSVNMYDLLNQDEQHSKKPQVHDGPGKPDKTEQRRSVPKSARTEATSAAAGSAASAPRQRTDDRERSGRGGRGGARGGRGGYHGNNSDGVHRNFDRKQGEHSKHAPGEARKHGAVGEVDNTQFAGSAADFTAQDAAQVADANGDIVGDMIMEMVAPVPDPEDNVKTFGDYLASKAVVDDDVNRQRREVIVPDADDENFKAAKPFQKKEEETFFDSVKSPKTDAPVEAAEKSGKKNKKGKISLDEFVGVSGPVAMTESGEREGIRGGRGGSRGGRGGFDGASRGGRGGFDGPRGERRERDGESASSAPHRGGRGGARGGRDGEFAPRGRGAPRGGRGGFDGPRGPRAPAANVNIADQSAFPALSPK